MISKFAVANVKKRVVLALLFFALLLTLNRLSIIFALLYLTLPYVKQLRPVALVFSLSCCTILIFWTLIQVDFVFYSNLFQSILPTTERFERVLGLFYIMPDARSFDYDHYIDNIATNGISRLADFHITLLKTNFGALGVVIYILMWGPIFIFSKIKSYDISIILYLFIICFKNWQFNIDLTLFFLFLVSKMDLKDLDRGEFSQVGKRAGYI